jgi:hypothetical protein
MIDNQLIVHCDLLPFFRIYIIVLVTLYQDFRYMILIDLLYFQKLVIQYFLIRCYSNIQYRLICYLFVDHLIFLIFRFLIY